MQVVHGIKSSCPNMTHIKDLILEPNSCVGTQSVLFQCRVKCTYKLE